MSMIQIKDLSYTWDGGADPVFDHCNVLLDTDWKTGLIGRNGRGKTTLLNLLQNNYPYEGTILSSVEFNYFPDNIENPSLMTLDILSNIAPAEDWEFIRELSLMHMDAEVLYRPFSTLSEGEKTRVLLAAHFLNDGQFQLIDEPTNHLDIEARKQLAQYLNRKKGFILVSHDRALLNACTDHIMSINRSTITVTAGNYATWKENFERQEMFELSRNEQLKKDIRRLNKAAERSKVWSDKTEKKKFGNGPVDRGFIGHKSASMMKRAKSIEARYDKAIVEKSSLLKDFEETERLSIPSIDHHKKELVRFENVSIAYDTKTVTDAVSFHVLQGEITAICGRNGSGKSSLLKCLVGHNISYTGTIETATNLILSYVPQDSTFLKGPLSSIEKERDIDPTMFRTLLRKLGFERYMFEKNMETYSLGQKKKVLLAASLCEHAHLYVWDEPLNYLDIDAREQIEEMICRSHASILLVEHDAEFLHNISAKSVHI